MGITIYHNPRCSKSRETLELLRSHGHEPEIIEYLKTPPDAATLTRLLRQLGLSARQLMRTKESVYKQAGLDDSTLSEQALIAAMTQHPVLIERPIVVRKDRAKLGRPPESVLELLG